MELISYVCLTITSLIRMQVIFRRWFISSWAIFISFNLLTKKAWACSTLFRIKFVCYKITPDCLFCCDRISSWGTTILTNCCNCRAELVYTAYTSCFGCSCIYFGTSGIRICYFVTYGAFILAGSRLGFLYSFGLYFLSSVSLYSWDD